MKARELSGLHVGKKITVDQGDVVVAGTLIKVVHHQGLDRVEVTFKGGIHLIVKRDAEVEDLLE
jgi:sRNA-binding protein